VTLLSDDEIRRALADLPGWELGDKEIVKQFTFKTFRDAIAFINKVADAAEAANHHPELTNVYARVRVALSTHDAGGVTEKDISLARAIEAAAS
jgi:4a-hydroxytetrahydrobiopterin dehydratase